MRDELKKEFTLRITQANKTELVVILYEMFLTYCQDAKTALAAADNKECKLQLNNARACLKELTASLNLDVEPATTIMRVYLYIHKLLARADIHKDVTQLEDAIRLMDRLREGYMPVAAADHSEPIMSNTQTVYAGLTYSKNDLSVTEQGSFNRGFLV